MPSRYGQEPVEFIEGEDGEMYNLDGSPLLVDFKEIKPGLWLCKVNNDEFTMTSAELREHIDAMLAADPVMQLQFAALLAGHKR